MGAFLTADKNGWYWTLLSYLRDENVYVTDSRLVPYTPGKIHTYTDFFPELWNAAIPTTLKFYINGNFMGYANIVDESGMVYLDMDVPLGAFSLKVIHNDTVLREEFYISKNYAMFLGVMAQSYDERLNEIELNKADQKFQEMRSGRLYNNIGQFFDFPPPAGWPNEKYRAVLLGGCGPGFIRSFFHGGTLRGIVETIKSITCNDPIREEAQGGVRWIVRSDANTHQTDPNSRAFFVRSDGKPNTFVAPHYRAVVASEDYWENAVRINVIGASRTVSGEEVVRGGNSYLEAPIPEPFDLSGLSLQFTIEEAEVEGTAVTYNVSFPMPTHTANDAAAFIKTICPILGDATYGIDGFLRLGIQAQAGKVFRITLNSGTALSVLGWEEGMAFDVSGDHLANPWIQGTLAIVDEDGNAFVQGVDFNLVAETGEIVWMASSLVHSNIPNGGSKVLASYTYQMRREIEHAVNMVKRGTDIIEYVWS